MQITSPETQGILSGMLGHIELQTAAHDEHIPSDQVRNRLDIHITNPKIEMMKDETIQKHSMNCSLCCTLFCLYFKYFIGYMDHTKFEEETNSISPETGIYVHRAAIRQYWLLFIGILLCIFGSADSVAIPQWVVVTFFFVLLVLPIVIGIYAKCSKGTQTVKCRINEILGIPNADPQSIDALFGSDRKDWGILFLFSIIVVSFNGIITFWVFYLPPELNEVVCLDHSDNSRYWTDPIFRGKCVVNASQISMIYVLAMAIVSMCSSYYRVNDKYVTIMNNYLLSNDYNNLTTKVQAMKDDIQNKLQLQWKESKKCQSRVFEVIITFIVAVTFHVGVYGIGRNEILDGGVSTGAVVFYLWIYFSEASFLTLAAFPLVENLYHFAFALSSLS